MKDQGTRVVVIGGGGAGLSCALSLLDAYRARGGVIGKGGLQLTVLEAREQLGGRIGSERHGGFSIETGPATLQEGSPGLGELLQRIGLREDQVFSSDQASRRYVFRAGALRRLPSKPTEVLFSDALSIPARLRLIWEPLIAPARPEAAADESVAAFGRRRLGSRVTSELIDPFMSGIFAGDIEKLSLRSTLPRLWQMEAEHRSLFKALKHKQAEAASRVKAGGAPSALPRLFGFRQGIGQLAAALGRSVVEAGGTIRLSTAAQALRRAPGGGAGYEVILAGDGGGERLPAERVVLALPPPDAAALTATLDPALGAAYQGIPMASVVAISLAWPREQVPHPLDGFGFLIPRREGLLLLGTLFMTSILPDYDQAPKGQVVLRAIYGGAHHAEVVNLDDGALLEQVRRDLKVTLGILTEPRFIHIQRWPRAIEQYLIGHAGRIAALEARLGELPGLAATGAAFRGVSVPDVLRQGQELGARLAGELPLPG
jgi:oxygen-dependent protoporphyrinogen oxidase